LKQRGGSSSSHDDEDLLSTRVCTNVYTPLLYSSQSSSSRFLLHKHGASLRILSAFTAFCCTFLSFDFYGTLLGLIALLLVSSSTCQQWNATCSTAACFLCHLTSGMSWWTVLALLLITYCDDYGQEILMNATNATTTTTTTTNATTTTTIDNSTAIPTTVLSETEELTEGQIVVCEHHSWILLFTTLAAMLWMVTGCLLMPVVLEQQALQEVQQRQRRHHRDGDTVATCDDDADDEWEDVEMTNPNAAENIPPNAQENPTPNATTEETNSSSPGPEENERGNGIQPTENL